MLAALWEAGRPLVAAEVQAVVGGELAYTTVMTILVRLHDKGIIERDKVGRAYAYRTAVSESDVIAGEIRRLLGRGHDRVALLQGLLDGLPPGDEELLRRLLAEATARREETPGQL